MINTHPTGLGQGFAGIALQFYCSPSLPASVPFQSQVLLSNKQLALQTPSTSQENNLQPTCLMGIRI